MSFFNPSKDYRFHHMLHVEENERRSWDASCACGGWKWQDLPSIETAADAHGDHLWVHAFQLGIAAEARANRLHMTLEEEEEAQREDELHERNPHA